MFGRTWNMISDGITYHISSPTKYGIGYDISFLILSYIISSQSNIVLIVYAYPKIPFLMRYVHPRNSFPVGYDILGYYIQ